MKVVFGFLSLFLNLAYVHLLPMTSSSSCQCQNNQTVTYLIKSLIIGNPTIGGTFGATACGPADCSTTMNIEFPSDDSYFTRIQIIECENFVDGDYLTIYSAGQFAQNLTSCPTNLPFVFTADTLRNVFHFHVQNTASFTAFLFPTKGNSTVAPTTMSTTEASAITSTESSTTTSTEVSDTTTLTETSETSMTTSEMTDITPTSTTEPTESTETTWSDTTTPESTESTSTYTTDNPTTTEETTTWFDTTVMESTAPSLNPTTADIVFILDNSASVTQAQFTDTTNFIQNALGMFDVGFHKNVQVSIISLLGDNQNSIVVVADFDGIADSKELSDTLAFAFQTDGPNSGPGNADLGQALQYTMSSDFKNNGYRTSIGIHLIVYITTITQPSQSAITQAGYILHGGDYRIVAITYQGNENSMAALTNLTGNAGCVFQSTSQAYFTGDFANKFADKLYNAYLTNDGFC